jgi:hypothetical protein
MAEKEPEWTMSVPEAGKKYYGLGRNASYEAARRRDIPTVRVGKKIRAVPRKIELQLGGRVPSDPSNDG